MGLCRRAEPMQQTMHPVFCHPSNNPCSRREILRAGSLGLLGLSMGPACKSYLDEQRAKANPALRRAIDEIWRQILEEGR